MNALKILKSDAALSIKDLVNVIAAAGGRYVPLGDVANAFGMPEARPWNVGDIAKRGAAETGHHAEAFCGSAGGFAIEPIEIRLPDGAKFFQVVFGVEFFFVDGILANDVIEEKAARGHARAGRRGEVALRIDQGVAALRGGDGETFGNQHFKAVQPPTLPLVLGKAEARGAREDAHGVDAHGGNQIVLDEAEHLSRLADANGMLFETVVIAKLSYATDVNTAAVGGAEVDGHAVRLAMAERSGDPSPACHIFLENVHRAHSPHALDSGPDFFPTARRGGVAPSRRVQSHNSASASQPRRPTISWLRLRK